MKSRTKKIFILVIICLFGLPGILGLYIGVSSYIKDKPFTNEGADVLRALFGDELVMNLEILMYKTLDWYENQMETEEVVIDERLHQQVMFSSMESLRTLENINIERQAKPEDISPIILSPAMRDEGKWKPLIDGSDLLFQTQIRPDPTRPGSVVNMVAMDLSRLRFEIVIGKGYCTPEPPNAGEIPEEIKDRLVACFNGGFLPRHDDGGFILHGREWVSMKPDKATFCIFDDGSVEILDWTEENIQLLENNPEKQLVSARQNQPMLIENGIVNDMVHKWGLLARKREVHGVTADVLDWRDFMQVAMPSTEDLLSRFGITPQQTEVHGWRTGLGITQTGHLIYVAGNRLSAETLAQALIMARCYDGMHLDMNISNCAFNYYTRNHHGRLIPHTHDQRFSYLIGKYLEGYTHDFVCAYVSKEEYLTVQAE